MNNIRVFREKKGVSQQKFAESVCVSRSTVSMWETGRTNPTASKFVKIASFLGCTVDDLLREEKTKNVKRN